MNSDRPAAFRLEPSASMSRSVLARGTMAQYGLAQSRLGQHSKLRVLIATTSQVNQTQADLKAATIAHRIDRNSNHCMFERPIAAVADLIDH